MILLVSYPEDPHAQAVMGHLEEGGHAHALLDLSDLPERAALTVEYDEGRPVALEIGRDDGAGLDLTHVHTAWWRRPQAFDPASVTDPEVRLFTLNEWQEAIAGLWQLMDARWVNDPARDEVAARKAYQLRIASEVGLRVPRTLITSDPERARAFIETTGLARTIFKTFSCTHAVWRETRLVGEAELALLDSIRLAPVILQEYVPADADLRVTAVGGELFAAAIYSADTDYPVDFRMSLGQARTEPAELPGAVRDGLRRLLDRLGLLYGAIDLRRTPAGDYVFLEVNTAGEWLFVEERTGQPISRALADLLATPDGRGRAPGRPRAGTTRSSASRRG